MSKIGVIVCGNSGIDYIDHPYDIRVIRSILMINEKEYVDYLDITADKFYNMLKEDKTLSPKTAQTSTGDILLLLKNMKEDGYEKVIIITISSKLSGTYNGAMLASQMMNDMDVIVYDSKTVSYPEAFMALEASRMIETGHSIADIICALDFIRDNNKLYFAVDTLKYLVLNGRLSHASGFVGSLLKLKPLLEITNEGEVHAIEKIRTSKKAIDRVMKVFVEEVKGKDIIPYIINANNPEVVDYLLSFLDANGYKNVIVCPLTPVVGAHSGPRAAGIGYVLRKS